MEVDSWTRVDLGPALRGEIKPVVPNVLRRDDNRRLAAPNASATR
jgi:hypothetical protein